MMSFFDWMIPKHCYACDAMVLTEGLCGHCWRELRFISDPKCEKCCFEFKMNIDGLCAKCMSAKSDLEKVISIVHYNRMSKNIIMRFKNLAQIELMNLFIPAVIEQLKNEVIDYIIPVPLHWKRRVWRGYNQSAIIACTIAKLLHKPYLSAGLSRVVHTKANSGTKVEREAKVKNAFQANFVFDNSSILLVDDVYTTGATLEACAKVLKKLKASRVIGLTICKRM